MVLGHSILCLSFEDGVQLFLAFDARGVAAILLYLGVVILRSIVHCITCKHIYYVENFLFITKRRLKNSYYYRGAMLQKT